MKVSSRSMELSTGLEFTYLFGELISMSTVCIHMPKWSRCSTVAEQVHEFVDAFGVTDMETIQERL